jgi:hypothetical protein
VLRCHGALDRGDLGGARAALREASLRDAGASLAAALDALDARLSLARTGSVAADAAQASEAVHEAFEAALAAGAPHADGVGPRDGFRLYAAHIAEALSPEPGLSFRGWCALHFELAAGRVEAARRAAQRLVDSCKTVSEGPLVREPPVLRAVAEAALNEPLPLLPGLPPELEDLWSEAESLDLAGPPWEWVPALGALAGVFPLVLLRSAAASGASWRRRREGVAPVCRPRGMRCRAEVRGSGSGATEVRGTRKDRPPRTRGQRTDVQPRGRRTAAEGGNGERGPSSLRGFEPRIRERPGPGRGPDPPPQESAPQESARQGSRMAATGRSARALRLRVSLREIEPVIWRTLLVRESSSLDRLHHAIQNAMGWTNSHLYEFEIGGRRFTDLDTREPWDDDQPPGDARLLTLRNLRLEAGSAFTYLYDFGWIVRSLVLRMRGRSAERDAASHSCAHPSRIPGAQVR